MFTCESVQEERYAHWKKVLESCPQALAHDIELLSVENRINMMMNALNNSFTLEWLDVFQNIADMVYKLWNTYNG